MGTLYVVATPIGNLEDLTFRALRVLKEADLIAAEDTRKTMRLLSAYDIHTPMESYHRHSGTPKRERILELLESKDVALVSEAGMPGISDPGQDLIAEAIARGIPIVPVPGPSALLTALVVSGLPTDRFLYLGFLPRVRSDRRKLVASLAASPFTLVAFEAPHRLLAALETLEEVLGPRQAVAARELTKKFEEIVRGTLPSLKAHFEENAPRGEFTLVIGPPAPDAGHQGTPAKEDRERIDHLAGRLRAEGLTAREAMLRITAETGVSRRDAYAAWLRTGGQERQ